MKRRAGLLSSTLFIAGCMAGMAPAHAQEATAKTEITEADARVNAASNAATPAVAEVGHYAIGVADSIRINVWKNPDLSETLIVDPNGFISVPLIGDLHVAGKTTTELGNLLSARYAAYVVTPQVTVSVLEIRSRQVYVMGQVGKAGSYPLLSPLSVLQLIAQAGGLTPYAKRGKIYVLRSSNGQSQKIPFHYSNVTHADSHADFLLEPGDTVMVP